MKFFLFENVLKGPFQPLCTALLLDFDYQLPCTFERPAAIAAIAGDRQLAAPRGRAVGQSSSLQAAGGRFSSQASYGLAWLYKKSKVSFDLALKCSVGCIFVNPFSYGDGFARTS